MKRWVVYACPEHGELVEGPPTFTVRCRCGRVASITHRTKAPRDAKRP